MNYSNSNKKNTEFPDFLIIGAGKSGTTSLDNYLKQHPDIFMSAFKEPNFFALMNLSKEDIDNYPYYKTCVTDINDYQNLFRDARQGQLKGESSPMYLYKPDAAHNIKKHIPHAKLIAILRNPVDRLYSRYLHLAREERLPTNSFRDVLDKTTIWWERDDLVTEGFYYKNIKRYLDLFEEKNIKIYLFEELKHNTSDVLKDILNFLGVNAEVSLNLSVEYNKSGFKKSKFYDNLLGHNSIIKKSLKQVSPSLFSKFKKNVQLQKIVNYVQNKNLTKPQLDQDLKKEILTKIYYEDLRNLQTIINKDISSWMEY